MSKMIMPSVADGELLFNRACTSLNNGCVQNNFGPLHQGSPTGEIGKTTLNPIAAALLPQMFKFYCDKARWEE